MESLSNIKISVLVPELSQIKVSQINVSQINDFLVSILFHRPKSLCGLIYCCASDFITLEVFLVQEISTAIPEILVFDVLSQKNQITMI